jgi:hypothetical protein
MMGSESPMHIFCTLFDSNYLSRGLALYRSIERVSASFHLYIFAFDDRTEHILRTLHLPHATVIPLREFEDVDLRRVKPSRTCAEYCWTSTSSTILYVLEHYDVEICTYLDADMMFFASPQPLFDEMGDNSIIITEHRYTPRYDKSRLSGKYCVQFVTFRKDARGLRALRWWRERCLEWCYARVEDGKFGDQMYLDDWTTRFDGVHVLQHRGGGLAAWNIQQYEVTMEGNLLQGCEHGTEKKFTVIFYHYHYVRFFTDNTVELGRRSLTSSVLHLLYAPYIRELEVQRETLAGIDSSFDPHGASPRPTGWKTPLLYLYRQLRGVYNIYPKSTLLET